MLGGQGVSIDPRVKVFAYAAAISLAFICNDIYGLLLLISSFIIITTLSSSRTLILRRLRLVAPLVLLAFLLWTFMGEWSLFYKHGDGLSISLGAFMAMRLLFILLLSLSFVSTIKPGEVMAVMRYLKIPKGIGTVVALSFRHLYIVSEDYKAIKEALTTKSLELDKGSPIRRVRNYIRLLIPLLIRSIENAEKLVLAMKLRPISSYGKKLGPLSLRDKILTLAILSALLIGILYYALGVL